MEDNFISELEAGALWGCRALRTLRLARNLLRDVPTHALAPLHHLQTLYVTAMYLQRHFADSAATHSSFAIILLYTDRCAATY